MSEIRVLYSFARSGGTLVNQLLGVHPQCLVLSEVNPAASCKPVAGQAREWLGLIGGDEEREYARMPYPRQIRSLRERASRAGKRLVVRDWVTVNFLARASGDGVVPSGQLEQELYLEHAGLECLPVVVTRRAAAVYGSIRRNFAHLRDLSLDDFANAYLAYARTVSSLPRAHLEDLRAEPQATLASILRRFELDASGASALLTDFHEFRKCTGNTTLERTSASASARRVLPPDPFPGSPMPEEMHPALVEADTLLGYDR